MSKEKPEAKDIFKSEDGCLIYVIGEDEDGWIDIFVSDKEEVWTTNIEDLIEYEYLGKSKVNITEMFDVEGAE